MAPRTHPQYIDRTIANRPQNHRLPMGRWGSLRTPLVDTGIGNRQFSTSTKAASPPRYPGPASRPDKIFHSWSRRTRNLHARRRRSDTGSNVIASRPIRSDSCRRDPTTRNICRHAGGENRGGHKERGLKRAWFVVNLEVTSTWWTRYRGGLEAR